jgi:PHD/YefM family antitoxin component YafN of YafNO toxin-antitoxin module
MRVIGVEEAQSKLLSLMAETTASHQPIQIAGEREQAVLISEEVWRAIQETLYLLSIPGMRESIREGLNAPLSECDENLTW